MNLISARITTHGNFQTDEYHRNHFCVVEMLPHAETQGCFCTRVCLCAGNIFTNIRYICDDVYVPPICSLLPSSNQKAYKFVIISHSKVIKTSVVYYEHTKRNGIFPYIEFYITTNQTNRLATILSQSIATTTTNEQNLECQPMNSRAVNNRVLCTHIR